MQFFLILILWLIISCSPPKPTPEQFYPGDEGTLNWTPTFQNIPVKQPCSPAKMATILAAPEQQNSVVIDCHLVLTANTIITKKLLLHGETSSGTIVDCNGGTIAFDGDAIEIRSKFIDNVWEPVHDVIIQNCIIQGSVRVWGMAINGEAETLYESSRTTEHIANVRNNAPYHITLHNLTIITPGRIPVYFAPGVHSSALTGSVIRGYSNSVMVYLDAESYGNVINGNTIYASDMRREIIALDGSSHNVLSNNHLLNVSNGGIYLYRNCGQGGNIRHATSSYNIIENNNIQCVHGWFDHIVGIFLGSRNGNRSYCNEDAGYSFGSSKSDYDHARFNHITQNVLYNCVIKNGNITNHSNIIE